MRCVLEGVVAQVRPQTKKDSGEVVASVLEIHDLQMQKCQVLNCPSDIFLSKSLKVGDAIKAVVDVVPNSKAGGLYVFYVRPWSMDSGKNLLETFKAMEGLK
ncbi:MAG TPA: hypothetical protein V6C97_26420 [Oculatellaceae cyanobacterium]